MISLNSPAQIESFCPMHDYVIYTSIAVLRMFLLPF